MPKSWTRCGTNKHGISLYGGKIPATVAPLRNPVRRNCVNDASVHDGQAVDHQPMQLYSGSGEWAHAAYRPDETAVRLRDRTLKSRIPRSSASLGQSLDALTVDGQAPDRTGQAQWPDETLGQSSGRACLRHTCQYQGRDLGSHDCSVGAKARIAMKTLADSPCRLGRLCRISPNPA